MVVISVKHSKGTYEGAEYDNIVFTCFSDDVPKSVLAGSPVEMVKVKADTVVDVLGKSISSIDWESIIGAEIIPVYNKFGQAQSFSISFDEASAPVEVAGESVPDIDSDTSLDGKGKKK